MAGVVAMASVIEDFDIQPCKKVRKDGGSPVVKTITNYFSPVPKPAEKPFSPPRSNNIMDYFSRKTPPTKERTGSPEQSKENCLTKKPTTSEAAVKQPSQKRGRKAIKTARRLVEADSVISTEEDSCFIVEPHDGRDSAAEVIQDRGSVLGSDTAVVLGQLGAESSITAGISEENSTVAVCADQSEKKESNGKMGNHIKPKQDIGFIHSSPVLPLKDKGKQSKTATQNARKKQHQETEQSEPEEKKSENSLCDISMDVDADEASRVNENTVTISFEDFLRSQSQDECEEHTEDQQNKDDENRTTTEAEMDTDEQQIPKSEEIVGSKESLLQISPQTVTIQAEVHVSPREEAVKAMGKVAPIFSRRKGAKSPADVPPPSQTETRHQCSPLHLTTKRKSNVVLQEEDLELAILESELTPKCSEAERKQFMAAFKQPSVDGSKTKPGKSQGMQKQPEEKTVDTTDKTDEDDIILISSEIMTSVSPEYKVAKKRPARKKQNVATEEKDEVTTLPAADPEEESRVAVNEAEAEKELSMTSTPSVPPVRRSRREAVVRRASKTEPKTPTRNTRKQASSKDSNALTQDSPAEISTPKRLKSQHRVFKAEMLCPPNTKQSPIRTIFTRVNRNVTISKAGAGTGNDTKTPLATKASKDSKKTKQAKKLVEKAKAIQQSRKASVTEKSTLRRSSRTEASLKKSYCEDEDSVICLEEDDTESPQAINKKSKTQKSLRSLNDVLGKATSTCKETSPGSKMSQEKPARKASAVVSIFNESSREGSENSQDDEQFRARREFLKSGLPESFRKQMVKTAATKEAHAFFSTSFQPVTHMTQPPIDCPFWSLPWPQSSLLKELRCHTSELWCHTSDPPPFVSDSLGVKTTAVPRACCERGSGWRLEISESVRQLLMEEVNASNPPFPAQKFITCFLKRSTDQQQHRTVEPQVTSKVSSTQLPAEAMGGKRKRIDDEGEMTTKVAKKQRTTHSGEKACSLEPEAEPTKRKSRTRRGLRSVLKEEEAEKRVGRSLKMAPVLSGDDLPLGQDTEKQDVVKEEVLWTDKYQPQHSSEILGNAASVKRLHSWLKEWKFRADREDRKKQKDKKGEDGGIDSDWDCGDEDSQDGEDMLCNTILITGPTGVGKTAAVYACAQELGFKVFEVNASSLRSGRLILSQLKEATQSHQVDSQGINAHKPTYFNSYGTSSSASIVRTGSSPRKVNSPRRVVSSPRKHPPSPRGTKRGGLAPMSLAKFFKMGKLADKEPPNTKKNEKMADSKNIAKSNEAANKQKEPAVKSPGATTQTEKNSEEQSKKTATSLILFEEVDVIFDDDYGFLAAIKTFMSTTKRPVILTTSDPAFSMMFDGSFEEIQFKTPSLVDVSSYLQLLCLTEDVRTDLKDISSLLELNGCDIRKSLLQLQFWICSAGGRQVAMPLTHSSKNELKPKTDRDTSILPLCNSGCTESMLGLLNIEPVMDIWDLLKSQSLVENMCWKLLTVSKQRGVDLLYSNMEALLPLPLTELTISVHKPEQSVPDSQDPPSVNPQEMPPDKLPSQARLLPTEDSADCSDDASPIKVSNRMKKNKKRHSHYDQVGLQSDSDLEDCFLSLCHQRDAPRATEKVKASSVPEKVKRKPPTPQEQAKSVPVSKCLQSVAEFLDDMSYIDSSVAHLEGSDFDRRMFSTAAMVKDGLTDESRIETDKDNWKMGECAWEIQAAVEALSFHKCQLAVTNAWDKVQHLDRELREDTAAELSLPVAPHHNGPSFTPGGPCSPQLVQQRREVIDSVMLKGLFGTVVNRQAAALDFLPALRTICRSEQLKEQGKVKRRFLHYLHSIHLGLQKSTLQHLAEDFP